VQVARGQRGEDPEVRRRVFHGERRSARRRTGQQGVAETHSRLPASAIDEETAKAYGVLNERGIANRWTLYIDKNGRISYIEKAVKPATSAEDMIAKLGELSVSKSQ
jgi:peroxiredoxin Q/BCP